MSHLLWIMPLILAAGLVWLGIKYRRQSSQMEELHKTLQEAVDTLQSLNTAHREKASQQESTQEKLRAYLHLMDTVINTIPNPIFFKDEKGVYQGCNRVFSKQLLGLTRDHIIGKRAQDLPDQIPPDVASAHQREELKMIEKGGFHSFEAQMQCADGKRRDYLVSLAPVHDANGEISGLVAIMSDLTDKNRAAQDRMNKEKLEGVLETAGAVCHELNQPLQALSGYTELLAAKMVEDGARSYLDKITQQIERMRDITDKLQGVTRYETTDYAGNTRIIDIHQSSQ